MSLLQQNPSLETTAPGEELTKGSSHIVWASVSAGVIVTIAIAVYVIAGQKPAAATGEVNRAVAHLMHRETAGFDASGAPMPKQEFDQVLLFTHVKLHNQSKDPLFLREILSNITLPDGVHHSYAAPPTDYERLFAAYPELVSLHGKSLGIDETIPAGEWLEGDFVSAFRMTKADWDSRKSIDYGISFRYQPELKLTSNIQVSEQ
jgi:hypothetical protein